jgi:hypothetical protein
LTKQFLRYLLCNRVKYLGLAGWVRPGKVGWQNDSRQYVEWVNALGERVDWREGYPPFRQCNSTSAVPQWLLKSEVDWVNTGWAVVPWSQVWWFRWFASQTYSKPVVTPLRPSWQTTEGTGGLDGTVRPYRKPPQASQSRGGRRYG